MALFSHRRVLALACIAESGVGLLLLVAPSTVVSLIFGMPTQGLAAVIARCFGIALVGLGVASAPSSSGAQPSMPRFGMGGYNALVALYLAYLGVASQAQGPLLWPTAVLHAGIALLLLRPAASGGTSPRASDR